MTNETDDDGAGDDGLEICRETYGGDVAVRVACRTSFRGTLLDGELDRTGLMQWPARVAVSEWLCAAREALKGKRLVELGCGAGGCGAVAVALGLDVLATDASPEALALAARNLAANAAPGARYDVARHVWGDGWGALGCVEINRRFGSSRPNFLARSNRSRFG